MDREANIALPSIRKRVSAVARKTNLNGLGDFMFARFSARNGVRVLAGVAVLGLALPAGVEQAHADGQSGAGQNPTSAEDGQHQRDAADGKFDPEHIRHKAEKEAAEVRDGLRKPDGIAPNTVPAMQLQAKMTPDGKPGLALSGSEIACAYQAFCLYYNSNVKSAMQQYWTDWKDFADQEFYGPGLPGAGQSVKNNAASDINTFLRSGARVYYNSNYQGASDYTAAQDWRNLAATYNDNASWHFA
ncbi:peptidase inhibitor family I36 protein [Streptomyces sp. NPDC020719]|uniref:peptidase inhibitor family I36 protein n=1 Tax=Streptomyces sp. NPDC020719 TaxID=3154896 RepID=UPI0033F20592